MGQLFLPENIPTLVRSSGTVVTLAATNMGQPTRVGIGGQQYTLTTALTLNTTGTGLNGLDTGSLGNRQTWYVYAVINSSFVVGLVASQNAPSVGPTANGGYTSTTINGAYRLVGTFNTNSSALIDSVRSSYLDGLPVSPDVIPGSLQVKSLAADFTGTSPATEATALTFNNLISGKAYRITFTGYNSGGSGDLWISWGSTSDSTKYLYQRVVTSNMGVTVSKAFVSDGNPVKIYLGAAGTSWLVANGNNQPAALTGGTPKTTFATLEELGSAIETTRFT